MIRGSDILVTPYPPSSATLPGAHDLDAVARVQRGLRPGSAWDHGAVERDGDTALAGVDGLFREQRGESVGGERLILAVDANVGLNGSVVHGNLLTPPRAASQTLAQSARCRTGESRARRHRRAPAPRCRRRWSGAAHIH